MALNSFIRENYFDILDLIIFFYWVGCVIKQVTFKYDCVPTSQPSMYWNIFRENCFTVGQICSPKFDLRVLVSRRERPLPRELLRLSDLSSIILILALITGSVQELIFMGFAQWVHKQPWAILECTYFNPVLFRMCWGCGEPRIWRNRSLAHREHATMSHTCYLGVYLL